MILHGKPSLLRNFIYHHALWDSNIWWHFGCLLPSCIYMALMDVYTNTYVDMFMCVCAYTYVYIYIYIYICIYIYIYKYEWIYIYEFNCTHTYIYVYVYKYIHIHKHIWIYIYIYVYICTYMYVYICFLYTHAPGGTSVEWVGNSIWDARELGKYASEKEEGW